MRIERYEQRVLFPDKGKWMYNPTEKIISDSEVHLAKEELESNWVEITQEEKEALEKEWEEETE